jgi:hypothetical protein
MKITPLLRHPTTTTWHNSHRLGLHNSGALPPVHELCKWPSYISIFAFLDTRGEHEFCLLFFIGDISFWLSRGGSGVHPASYPVGTGVKQEGREADYSPAFSPEIKNTWDYTSTSSIRLSGVVLNEAMATSSWRAT